MLSGLAIIGAFVGMIMIKASRKRKEKGKGA
jgi:hypothetical protein